MKLWVRLHGTLGSGESMEIHIPEGGKVKDLLSTLRIPSEMKALVVLEGRVLKPDDGLRPESHVQVFEPIHGG